MPFNVGDKVRFLDEARSALVIEVMGSRLRIEDEHGFEEIIDATQLVLESVLPLPDKIQIKDKAGKEKQSARAFKERGTVVIDLHYYGELGNRTDIGNYEILQFQMDKAKRGLEKAKRAFQKRIIFIHGLGEGRLRRELHEWLNSLDKLEYFDASYQEFGGGATEVRVF